MRSDQLDAVADEARAAYTINPYADRKNVVLIVVDALRADHMGVYGYSRPTTPALSRLAGSGAVRIVNEVRASCSSTVCGVRSLLTSRFAYQMSRRPITLHEVLKRYGYRVHVMIGDDHIHFYGLRGTYGEVDSYFDTAAPLNHPYTADDRLVLDRAAALPRWDGTPQLLHFHLISVHTLGRRDPRYARYTPAANYVVPGARNAASAKNYYDNGVLQADAVIGELLSTLDVKGYLRDALVVITADHGESLGEGGRYTHARGLTEEVLRIPLLFIAYGYKPAPLAADLRLASQVDVAPTVLRELRMDRPRTWVGSPLQDPFSRDFTDLEEVDAVGLIDHRDPARLWKYWVERGNGREHVLDLTAGSEGETPLQTVPPQLRVEWRRRCMHLVTGASPARDDR
jgi:glucan phosphoethanolaminetransferase (alkaline phosphatase superfamily)